jgi:hypothetical protein
MCKIEVLIVTYVHTLADSYICAHTVWIQNLVTVTAGCGISHENA